MVNQDEHFAGKTEQEKCVYIINSRSNYLPKYLLFIRTELLYEQR